MCVKNNWPTNRLSNIYIFIIPLKQTLEMLPWQKKLKLYIYNQSIWWLRPWPSIQYKFRESLVLWNHNNREDCWLSNDPEDDHWHPPQRVSHRGSLLKGVAVQGVLYQSILNAKLTGRKKLDRKRCKRNRDDRKLENTVKQTDSNTRESFTRSELKLELVHQESPRSDYFRKKLYQATSETETSSEAFSLG